MVAYSFRPRFVEPIRTGFKRQTIRADRKRHACPGEELQLYTGMRTKHFRLIARATCESITPITLSFAFRGAILVDKQKWYDLDNFAVLDGFLDWDDLCAFWREEHGVISEFTGVRITWRPLPQADAS